MTRFLSLTIVWGCTALLFVLPAAALVLLVRIDALAGLGRSNINLPIQWPTVSAAQWYVVWGITALYLSIGLVGLYFLRRAFRNFANGELFTVANSRDLRRFALLLLSQGLCAPVHMALLSVALSLNHPAGERMLSISFNGTEVRAIGIAFVMWVMSDLLLKACRLHHENRQFV